MGVGMSTGSIGSQSSIDAWRDLQRHRHTDKAGGTDPFRLDPSASDTTATTSAAGETDEAPSDTLSVEMPNGFKVSGTHLGGGSAFSAQLLGSMEDMIGFLNRFKPAGGASGAGDTAAAGSGANSGTATGSATGSADAYRCLDTFHTELGDGESVTLHYGTEKDGGNTDASAMEAMANAIQQIVGRYKSHKQPDLADLYGQLDSMKTEKA